MTLHVSPDLIQGSQEWHDQRRGIVTASVVGKLITVGPPDAQSIACPTCSVGDGPCLSMTRKEPTPIKALHDARIALAADQPPIYSVADNDTSRGITTTLAAERITGWTEETPMTSDMWRGVHSEPFARDLYAEHYGDVTQVGFMRREGDSWTLGYSPDALVGDDGLLEIKAPRAKTHVRTVIADDVPAHYMPQLQAGLLVTGRKWADFVPYVGGLPLWRKRVLPDPAWFAAITEACIAFETNVTQIVTDYEERVAGVPKTERVDHSNLGLVF